LWDGMVARGWSSMGEFAFAANYSPGQQDDSNFVVEIVEALTGDRASSKKAALRRLFFESFSQVATEMAARTVRADDEDKPRRLPGIEREARLEILKGQLDGLEIEEDLEPSAALVDKIHTMYETGELRYLKWEEITKREDEMNGVKVEPVWKTDGNGMIKQSLVRLENPADVSSELLLRFALQRRGVALHVGGLMTFKVHETIVKFLMRELRQEALPGYSKVSLEQIQNADRYIFTRAAKITAGNLRPDAIGCPKLDAIIPEVLKEHRLSALITQMPRSGGGGQSHGHKRESGELAELREEVKRLKAAGGKGGKQAGNNHPKGKGGGKQQKKGTNKGGIVPAELKGCNPTLDGKRLCFAYNLGGCDQSKDSCAKGLHKCMRPGCGKNHPAKKCSM
jgi:hypothetical protein